MFTRTLAFAAPLALAAALLSTSASAQSSCDTDDQCPKGYECQVTGGTTCATPDCPEGEECAPATCETQEFRDCVAVPNACTSDADCSDGMVCFSHTYEECSGEAAPCAYGEECPPPPPPECHSTTQSACLPRYMLPCQAAADCGEGFECKQEEICECSGSSGGSIPPDDGAGGAEPVPEPVPAEEPSCTCTPGDSSYCAIIEQVCVTDVDCPADWVCGSNPESVACSRPDGSSGTGAECGSTEPDKVCLPPYSFTVIGVAEDGGPVYAAEDDAGSRAGIGEGTPTSGPPAPGATPDTNTSGEDSDSGQSGGCSVGGTSSGSTAWLSLIGLAALLRRRRSAA